MQLSLDIYTVHVFKMVWNLTYHTFKSFSFNFTNQLCQSTVYPFIFFFSFFTTSLFYLSLFISTFNQKSDPNIRHSATKSIKTVSLKVEFDQKGLIILKNWLNRSKFWNKIYFWLNGPIFRSKFLNLSKNLDFNQLIKPK